MINSNGYKETALGVIPNEWDVIKIQDLIETKRIIGHLDGNHGELYPKSDEFTLEGIPYVGANNFKNGKVDFSNCKRLSIERSLKFKKGVAKNGDVLFAHNATVGPVAYLQTDLDFVILSTTATYFRLDNKTINAKYWLNYLDSPFFKNQYIKVMGQSTRNQVPITMQRSFFAILPNYSEQQKIAEILSTVDAKIEVIDLQITETQVLKKGLMQRLLTKGIGHTEFKDSPLGEIPKSWEVVRIGDLGNVVTGSTPKTSVDEFYAEEGILWASPSDLTNIKYVNTTKKKLSPLGFEQTRKLPPKSILVTCIGSTIGKIGMTNSWMSTNQQINSIVCSDLNDSEFYYYVIEKNAEAIKSMAGTQAVPLLNKTDFSNVLVIKPNLIEQQKISEILSSIDDKLEVLSEKKTHYQELKQGLMQQLLTGKIRVN
jgi:type I restriction enzyme S subunit